MINNRILEWKNTITEMKNVGLNSRFELAEERVSEYEDRATEIIQSEEEKEKNKQNEQSLRGLWNTIKHTNTHIMGVPKGKRREKGAIKNLRKNNDFKTSQIL